MKSLRNRVTLIGNLGITPTLFTLESGARYVRVSLATNETYKNSKGEKITETQWHQLVAWNSMADLLVKYTKAGTRIAVEGKLVNRQWIDMLGQKRHVSEVLVGEVMLLGTVNHKNS